MESKLLREEVAKGATVKKQSGLVLATACVLFMLFFGTKAFS